MQLQRLQFPGHFGKEMAMAVEFHEWESDPNLHNIRNHAHINRSESHLMSFLQERATDSH